MIATKLCIPSTQFKGNQLSKFSDSSSQLYFLGIKMSIYVTLGCLYSSFSNARRHDGFSNLIPTPILCLYTMKEAPYIMVLCKSSDIFPSQAHQWRIFIFVEGVAPPGRWSKGNQSRGMFVIYTP